MKKTLLIALSLLIMALSFFGCDVLKNDKKSPAEPYPEANPASDFEYAVHPEDNYAAITKYIGTAKDVVIPQAIDDCPVKLISPVSFMGTDIRSVVMPDSVTVIGDYAFKNCRYLETVKFSNSLQVISDEAFRYCISLREAILPSSLERVGSQVFYQCTALKTVKIPKNLSQWGQICFAINTGLKTIIIEDGTKVVGKSLDFANCYSLEEIVFPASVTKLSCGMFSGCAMLNKVIFLGDAPEIDEVDNVPPFGVTDDLVVYYDPEKSGWDTTYLRLYYDLQPLTEGADISIKKSEPSTRWGDYEYEIVSGECGITKYIGTSSEVEIPKIINGMSVSWIGRAAFSYSNVEKISMSSLITRMEVYAFAGCSDLKEIVLSESINTLEEGVFKDCMSLTGIDIGKITEIKDEAFMNCGLESITIPKTLEKLTGERAFYGNSYLSSLIFEDGIKSIGSLHSFTNLGWDFTEITFPASVESISNACFLNCPSLTKVIFLGDAPTVVGSDSSATPFDCNEELTIYYDPTTNGWDTTSLKDSYNLEPMSLSALTTTQRRQIEDYINDPSNEAHDALYNDDDVKKIVVLGGEVVGNDRYVITCARILDGIFQDVGVYTVTLGNTENGYSFISNIKNDSEMIRSAYEKAINAHQIDPENERNIGYELCDETVAVCRMDDGKYYQILSATSYDMILVLVSNDEHNMYSEWDWIPIGQKDTCTIENLGKIEDSAQ